MYIYGINLSLNIQSQFIKCHDRICSFTQRPWGPSLGHQLVTCTIFAVTPQTTAAPLPHYCYCDQRVIGWFTSHGRVHDCMSKYSHYWWAWLCPKIMCSKHSSMTHLCADHYIVIGDHVVCMIICCTDVVGVVITRYGLVINITCTTYNDMKKYYMYMVQWYNPMIDDVIKQTTSSAQCCTVLCSSD